MYRSGIDCLPSLFRALSTKEGKKGRGGGTEKWKRVMMEEGRKEGLST